MWPMWPSPHKKIQPKIPSAIEKTTCPYSYTWPQCSESNQAQKIKTKMLRIKAGKYVSDVGQLM